MMHQTTLFLLFAILLIVPAYTSSSNPSGSLGTKAKKSPKTVSSKAPFSKKKKGKGSTPKGEKPATLTLSISQLHSAIPSPKPESQWSEQETQKRVGGSKASPSLQPGKSPSPSTSASRFDLGGRDASPVGQMSSYVSGDADNGLDHKEHELSGASTSDKEHEGYRREGSKACRLHQVFSTKIIKDQAECFFIRLDNHDNCVELDRLFWAAKEDASQNNSERLAADGTAAMNALNHYYYELSKLPPGVLRKRTTPYKGERLHPEWLRQERQAMKAALRASRASNRRSFVSSPPSASSTHVKGKTPSPSSAYPQSKPLSPSPSPAAPLKDASPGLPAALASTPKPAEPSSSSPLAPKPDSPLDSDKGLLPPSVDRRYNGGRGRGGFGGRGRGFQSRRGRGVSYRPARKPVAGPGVKKIVETSTAEQSKSLSDKSGERVGEPKLYPRHVRPVPRRPTHPLSLDPRSEGAMVYNFPPSSPSSLPPLSQLEYPTGTLSARPTSLKPGARGQSSFSSSSLKPGTFSQNNFLPIPTTEGYNTSYTYRVPTPDRDLDFDPSKLFQPTALPPKKDFHNEDADGDDILKAIAQVNLEFNEECHKYK